MSKIDSSHPDLETLLKNVKEGRIVVPDFQRSFVWDPEAVRELLVSIVAGYYIGSLLSLSVQKSNSPFAIKLIEGVEIINPNQRIQPIVDVILDGQQRISSLFYAFYQPHMGLKNQLKPYYYFLDVDQALKAEKEFSYNEAVIGVSSNHVNKIQELRDNKSVIEFNRLGDDLYIYNRFSKHKKIRQILELIKSINRYELTLIELPDKTDLDRIVETFARINRFGKPLSIFELLTARLYLNKIKLRDILEESYQNEPLLCKFEPETILRVLCLLIDEEPSKDTILKKLIKKYKDPKDFVLDWNRACNALVLCYNKLTNLNTGYGVIDIDKWMPYYSMIIPLAALLQHLHETNADNQTNFSKLDCWYWRSIFNERYEQSSNSVSYQDYTELLVFFKDKTQVPKSIKNFKPTDIDFTVDSQGAAIYRGIICMIVKKGAYDFITGQEPKFEPDKIQDDHIFPKKTFKENGILNRTLITKKTNLIKAKKIPSKFFKDLTDLHSKITLDQILEKHLFSADCIEYLLKDDIVNFMKSREKFILEEIRKITDLKLQ